MNECPYCQGDGCSFCAPWDIKTQTIEFNISELANYVDPDVNKARECAKHGMTMLMMYRATGEVKYLDRANADYKQMSSFLRSSQAEYQTQSIKLAA